MLFEVGVLVVLLGCSAQKKPISSAPMRPVQLLEPGFDLVGYWLRDGLMDGSALLLSYPLDGRYTVRFSSAGCVGSEVKQVNARFESGFLYLSEAVVEYGGRPIERLALFQFGDKTVLVPDGDIADFTSATLGHTELPPGEFAFVRLSAIP